jgi:hypothetical protein
MCGRYTSFLPAEAVARIFCNEEPAPGAVLERRGTMDAPIVPRHRKSGERYLGV